MCPLLTEERPQMMGPNSALGLYLTLLKPGICVIRPQIEIGSWLHCRPCGLSSLRLHILLERRPTQQESQNFQHNQIIQHIHSFETKSSHSTMTETPALVVFGPQITTWPSPDLLVQLRDLLLQEPQLQEFLQAINELPQWLDRLVAFEPSLEIISSKRPITAILDWIDSGKIPDPSDTFPNALLAPLTIIIQYLLFFRHKYIPRNTTEQISETEAQGMCTGFLMASALSFSTNMKELQQYASVALRLALCIGAVVDLDAAESDSSRTSCLAVRWRTEKGREGIDETLESYPGVSLLQFPSLFFFLFPFPPMICWLTVCRHTYP